MYTADKIAERNKSFQQVLGNEDYNNIKEQNTVVLRKKKRLEHISKRRADMLLQNKPLDHDMTQSENLEFPSFLVSDSLKSKYQNLATDSMSSTQRLSHLITYLKISKLNPDLELVNCLNRLMMRTKNFPYEKVFDQELISCILVCLETEDNDLIYECFQILANIFWDDPAQIINYFLDMNVVGLSLKFIQGLHSEIITESALWTLANLMADHKNVAREIYVCGIWRQILKFCFYDSYTLRGTAQWTICNLSKSKCFSPQEKEEVASVCKVSIGSDNEGCIKEAAWTLFYLSEDDESLFYFLFTSGIVQNLFPLIKYHDKEIQLASLKIFGNISTSSNNDYFISLIDLSFLPNLSTLLTHPDKKIKSEVLFIFSNFLYSSPPVVLHVVQLPAFKILSDFLNSSDFRLKKEAICGVCNAACSNDWEIIKILIEMGLIPKVVSCLNHQNHEVVYWVLDAIYSVLSTMRFNKDFDELVEFVNELQNMNEFERVNNLVYSHNMKISQKSGDILNFFNFS